MLEIRPSCEHCDMDLVPHSTEAMICSFECTFCRDCVDQVLSNVCPNCGGGFEQRPIRPSTSWRENISLEHAPASTQRICEPVDPQKHREFAREIRQIPPESR